MGLISLALVLVFGALVGWLTSKITHASLSLGWSIALGIVGAVVGTFAGNLIGLRSAGGMFSFNIGNILISVGGACLVVWLFGKMER